METKAANSIKESSQELLQKLKIEGTVDIDKKDEVYELTIDTQESGLLIGYHGSALNAFQIILSTLIFKKTGQWKRIIVNIGDYRERREEFLKNLAQEYAQQALTTKETITLPYLTPAERRIVHIALQDHKGVISESQGEGKSRRLTIRPKDTN